MSRAVEDRASIGSSLTRFWPHSRASRGYPFRSPRPLDATRRVWARAKALGSRRLMATLPDAFPETLDPRRNGWKRLSLHILVSN